MNGVGKTASTFAGSGFAALMLGCILVLKSNTGLVIEDYAIGLLSIGFTWLGNRLFSVVTKEK